MTTKRPTKKGPEQSGPVSKPLVIKNPPLDLVAEIKQRKSTYEGLIEIAARLETGEELSGLEQEYAAAALRAFAVIYRDTRTPKPRARPAKLDPGTVALDVALILLKQHSAGEKLNESAAHATLAERYDVDPSSIAKAAAPMLAGACLMVHLPVTPKSLRKK